MNVRHHDAMAKFVRPVITLIDHGSSMRVAAAELVVFSKTAPGFSPIISGEVFMVRARLHQAVEVRIEIFAEHPLVVRSGDQVPEMTDNVIREKRLSVF